MTAVVHRLPVVQSRPRTRADCKGGPRPCPHDWCRHYLPHPDHSCVLDEVDAAKGEPILHSAIGKMFGWNRSSSWVFEKAALRKLAKRLQHLQGARIARAISALASVQGVRQDARAWARDVEPYHDCDGWAVAWPLNTERIYELYEREIRDSAACGISSAPQNDVTEEDEHGQR